MNFILLGYILACLGFLYSTYRLLHLYLLFIDNYLKLKKVTTEINLSKESIIFLLSIVYIITYHIS